MTEPLLTPSKVTAWLECEHYLTLRRRTDASVMVLPEPRIGAFSRLVMEKGEVHERACLEEYRARGCEVVEVPEREPGESFGDWVGRVGGVLDDWPEVVFQMPLVHDGMRGIADFLERVDVDGGGFTYEPVDAKLARSEAKPGHVLQLSFYADAIKARTGYLPEKLHLWLGSGQRDTIRTSEVRAYWHRLRGRLFEELSAPPIADGTRPAPCNHCAFCEFQPHCEAEWREADALHLVANIHRAHRTALEGVGVERVADLATRSTAVDGLADNRLDRLREQAALQVAARELDEDAPPPFRQIDPPGEPPWGHGHGLLPEPDDGDVFLDFEGHPFWQPDRGLFFLFGFIAKGRSGDWEFTGRWAHSPQEEADAVAWLVETLREHVQEHPNAHVYHYNHTERSALQTLVADYHLDDSALGAMVREGVFVDLLDVVRNAVQIGAESYSLKQVERLTGYVRDQEIVKGSGAVVEYEAFMERVPAEQRSGMAQESAPELTSIAAYNEDDVRATKAVRDWLVEIRPPSTPWRPARVDNDPENEQRAELVSALLALDDEADHLLADILRYWSREGRAHAARLRASVESPLEDLLIDEDALGGLHAPATVERRTPTGKVAKHPGLELWFPEQSVGPLERVMYLTDDGTPGYCTVHELDAVNGRVVFELDEAGRERGDVPSAVVGNDWVDPSTKRTALATWVQEVVAAGGVAQLDDARSQLLRGVPPRFGPGEGPLGGVFSDDLEQMADWVDSLDRSWLAVQGPPGTGKSYRGARVIRELIRRGRRVGITAMSHAAIHNLVRATHRAFAEVGALDELSAVVRRNSVPEMPIDGVDYTKKNPDRADQTYNLVAGTPWLFASSSLQGSPVDVLVVDEAGQLSLVDVLAAGGSATNLLLLGDPQQLPQVSLALHPNGSGASVLEHVLGDRRTIPVEDGVFLPTTWRMHPDVCGFISEQFYDGRVGTHPSCENQATDLGTGLRWIRADHAGCSTRSEEEVALVIAEVERLLGRSWTDQRGDQRSLGTADILIVTPYNDQKRALQEELAGAGHRDIRVGTVDKFQGQEAPVVFFSAATSSADDAPRGLGFVFNRNRFNVAVSRARCLSYLVCTDALLDATARTVDEMRTINAACGFVDHAATPVSGTG